MLISVSASDPRFKPVTLGRGFNVLVADRIASANELDSRNGSGKTSVVEVIQFALGGERGSPRHLGNAVFDDWVFTLELDWPNHDAALAVSRSVGKPSVVHLSDDIGSPKGTDPTPVEIPTKEWIRHLGSAMFGMPFDNPPLSARLLLGLYARRVTRQGFQHATKTHSSQRLSYAATGMAYLLGLDWKLAQASDDLYRREAIRKKVGAAVKDPDLGLVKGTAAELRGAIAAASQRVATLQSEVDQFRVVPEYERLQDEADEIDRMVKDSRIQELADRRNLGDIDESLQSELTIPASLPAELYDEMARVFPGESLKRYAEVDAFHRSVAVNRASYLKVERREIMERLSSGEALRRDLGDRHSRLMRDLDQGGALESFAELQRRSFSAQNELVQLEARLQTLNELQATQIEFKRERIDIQEHMAIDLTERDQEVRSLNALFQRFAHELYGSDRPAHIDLSMGEERLKIEPYIGGGGSQGIGNMMIFCFDFTFAITAHRAGHGPDFLVHDSHLFDGVDIVQVSRALQLAQALCEQESFQYFVTLNSDVAAQVENTGNTIAPYVIQPHLTNRYADGGLFGFHFD